MGYVTFDTSNANQTSAHMMFSGLPNTQNPRNSILLSWNYDAMTYTTNTIKYNTTGTVPNRRCVISYDSLKVTSALSQYIDSVWYFTGEIILYETTNIIETHIHNLPTPSYMMFPTLCLGIQNESATFGIQLPSSFHVFLPNRGVRYSPYNAPLNSIPICMVSVDSATGKNIIVWNQPMGIPIDSFIILKETSQAGVYAPIGSQLATVFSTFIDNTSAPAVQANRYKLGFRDSCGIVAMQSANHKTIHLSINQGVGSSWNLIWDAYEGFSFSSYNIYSGTSPSTMTLLTTIASTLYQYTDLTPPSTVYYAIEVVNPGGCSPSARIANNYSSSMSNIVNPTATGINELQASQIISIYPTPASTILNIHSISPTPTSQLIITDLLGTVVYKEMLTGIDNTIPISTWSAGIYFYEVRGDGTQANPAMQSIRGKFVVQR